MPPPPSQPLSPWLPTLPPPQPRYPYLSRGAVSSLISPQIAAWMYSYHDAHAETDEDAQAQRDEPVRAWKLAKLVRGGRGDGHGVVRFEGLVFPARYDVTSTFECLCWLSPPSDLRHKLPRSNSTCGFHAVSPGEINMAAFGSIENLWLLEVDLWGRVIRHTTGYRASRQRVLSVRPVSAQPLPEVILEAPAGKGSRFMHGPRRFMWPEGSRELAPSALAAQLGTEVILR